MKTIFLTIMGTILMTGLVVTSCQKTETEIAESVMKNIKYGSDPLHTVDVYLPAGRSATTTKTIIFIHGGSWSAGDKTDFDQDIATIRHRLPGYAIFNINYRLAGPQARFPAQIEDIDQAIDFISNKAGEYKINAGKIALVGASAGAHLALQYGYKHNLDGKIKAIIDLFGPTDLAMLYNNHPIPAASQPVLQNLLGTTPSADSTAYAQASPIHYVEAQSPPTLILHGDMDFIVPIAQSTALRAKLQQAGATVEMHTYLGEGHGWFGNTLQDTYDRTINFVKQHVQ